MIYQEPENLGAFSTDIDFIIIKSNFFRFIYKNRDDFVTVRSCPIHIDNVISLTSIHSTQYKAICKAGYHLDGSSSFYECKDGAWKPQIQCRMNITETIGNDINCIGNVTYAITIRGGGAVRNCLP